MSDITVVIPTIPPRQDQLTRALRSVHAQRLTPFDIVVQVDTEKRGAAINRDAGVVGVSTKWVAFLDDDDEFLPDHLQGLLETAEETDADLVYAWYEVVGGSDPLPFFGQPWNPSEPHLIPMTFMVKTDLFREVGGFSEGHVLPEHGLNASEDWHFTQKFNDAGYKIVHRPSKTYLWHHHGANTSGLSNRW